MRRVIWACLLLPVFAQAAEPIVTDSTTKSTVHTTGEVTTTLKSPPPSAISPSLGGSNSDSCTVGVAGAVQTQILGISAGTTSRDLNCERLKNAKTLYDMGMKVAAVSVLCQDLRVFDAMLMAGTPCPYNGIIGADAKIAWENDAEEIPKPEINTNDDTKKFFLSIGGAVLGLLLLL
tara:strand:+ start:94 stop:624 length:531 start_codon:yes stop_codon:yes gene_type:complete